MHATNAFPAESVATVCALVEEEAKGRVTRQARFEVLVPDQNSTPPVHCRHGVQAAAFGALEKDPDAHAAQVRSIVAVGALVTKFPAVQVVHEKQLVAFVMSLKVPLPQGRQVLSVVAVPCWFTDVPN